MDKDKDLNTRGVENQVKGTAKEVEGKARNAAGGLTGDVSEQVKGKAKEVSGKVQKNFGKGEQNADDDNNTNTR